MEGAPHTAKRLSVVLLGCPLATYIKEGGREEAGQVGRAKGGVLLGLLVQVGFAPPFSFLPPEGKEGGEKEKEGGGRAPTPYPIRFGQGEERHLMALSSLSPLKPTKAH